MKRTRWIAGSALAMTMTVAACGNSSPKVQSEDDFIAAMNTVCRTANRAIGKLDASDDQYVSDVISVMEDGQTAFDKLNPPKSLEDDFNDFTDNLDDQITQADKLRKAIKDGDDAAAQKAGEKLDELTKNANKTADSIGADRCVDVGVSDAPTTDTVADTTPNTPLPIDTTPITEPATVPVTEPPITEDTLPDMTAPSTPPASGTAGDASTIWNPPAGYSWGTLDDLASTQTPSDDPVLGPLLDGYYAGLLNSDSGGNGAVIYVTLLKQDTDWTQEQLDAYYTFELVDGGTDSTTPNGLPIRTKLNALDGFDAAAITGTGVGVAVIAPNGADLAALLDGFVAAQPSG